MTVGAGGRGGARCRVAIVFRIYKDCEMIGATSAGEGRLTIGVSMIETRRVD